MRIIYSLTFALLLSVSVFGQTKTTDDPLKPYTKCKLSGGLKVMDVIRRPKSAEKYRAVKTANGAETVSVADGYTVMFSYDDMFYYFANVKIDRSVPASYAQDKERIISSLKFFSTTKQATGVVFTDRTILNGFEYYGIDRDKIDVGGTVGTHVLFYDRHHLIVTVYFLNQDDRNNLFRAASSGPRRFNSIAEYQPLRDEFLTKYSECLGKVAAIQP